MKFFLLNAMDTPRNADKKNDKEDGLAQTKNITPKSKNQKVVLDDYHQYGLHRECSPNGFGCSQDTLEIGWGDSPEPLHFEQKFTLNTTPINCKKKLETKESPRSSNSLRYRRTRSSLKPPQKPAIDVAKYIAELQELSKNIVSCKEISDKKTEGSQKENNFHRSVNTLSKSSTNFGEKTADVSNLLKGDDLLDECLIACTQSVETKLEEITVPSTPMPKLDNNDCLLPKVPNGSTTPKSSHQSTPNKDSSFDRVLQSFNNEDDDWLSQVVFNQPTKRTPGKGNFVKSRSENQLVSPGLKVQSVKKNELNQFNHKTQVCLNNNIRRTCSSDALKPEIIEATRTLSSSQGEEKSMPPLKKQKSFYTNEDNSKPLVTRCSMEEIERKRLEAECRRKKKEIERKRLEAVKKRTEKTQGLRTRSSSHLVIH